MYRTILYLIITILVFPFIAIYSDLSLTELQWNALDTSVRIMLVIALTCFIASEISRNYSQTDKLWSITPIIYVWYFAFQGDLSTRLIIMAVLISIWGIRLSYNFGRRGGYNIVPWKGMEDHRWGVLKEIPMLKGRIRWGIFNLVFISLYQHTLVLLICLPALFAIQEKVTALTWIDILATLLILLFILIETVADQQQYNFQKEKYRRIHAKEDLSQNYADGFVSTGLWKYSRHPNFAAEQAIWISFYLFSVSATGQWINWSLAGAVLLVLLFFGSSSFTEKITAAKYPEYKHYQKRTGRYLPRIF